jgi:hypothetical protein
MWPQGAFLSSPISRAVWQDVPADVKGSDPFALCVMPESAAAIQRRARGLVFLVVCPALLPLAGDRDCPVSAA